MLAVVLSVIVALSAQQEVSASSEKPAEKQECQISGTVVRQDGGEPLKVLDVPTSANSAIPARWTSDGRMLTFVDTREGVSNIWGIAFDAGAVKQLTDFKTDQIFSFDWSRDGHALALARGDINNDVVLISNFK